MQEKKEKIQVPYSLGQFLHVFDPKLTILKIDEFFVSYFCAFTTGTKFELLLLIVCLCLVLLVASIASYAKMYFV